MDTAGAPPAGSELGFVETRAGDWRLGAERVAWPKPEPVAAAPAQAQAQAIAGQITLAVGTTRDRRVEIRLDPPELGRVQIQLTPTDGGLQAVVLAERPETQDLLRRHAEVLARDLGDAGYGEVSLDFAAGGQTETREQETRAEARPAFGASERPATAADAPAPARRRPAAGGLDIRL